MALLPENARREAIAAAVAAHDPGQQQSVEVPWKDATVVCPVVEVPLDVAALNPHSHRIRAELESDDMAEEIRNSPYSEEAQGRIAQILREFDGFGALKQNLAEETQRDHGVITDAGLLVNANTRAVALRDLDQGYIKVAVLPGDATEREIADLEVRLQMQRDFKQDYTFTNEILFVEDLRNGYHYSTAQVAKILRRDEKTVDQFTRMLALIRDLQRRSDNKIPLRFFNDQSVSLEEIDKSYEGMKERDLAGARRLRETRIIGILGEIQYRDLRAADENFVDEHLSAALKEQDELGTAAALLINQDTEEEGTEAPPGVDDLEDEPEEPESDSNPGNLVDVLAMSFGEDKVTVPTVDGGEQEVDRADVMQAVVEAYSDAVAEAKTDEKREKGLTGPINLLKDARGKLRRTLPAYKKVAQDGEFNQGNFDYQVNKLKSDVDALVAEVEKQKQKRDGN